MKTSPSEAGENAIAERLLAVLLHPWFIAVTSAVLLGVVSFELASLRDEAIWGYSAWLWAEHDAPPYVGSFENKPAGVFLLYRLSYAIFGLSLWPVRILSGAAMIGTLLLLNGLGRRYLGRIAGGMAALIFGLAMAHHLTDGYMLAVTEPFMVFFIALAFCGLSAVYWRDSAQGRWLLMLGIGAALGAALAFKQIALADILGMIPMYWVAVRRNATPRTVVRDVLAILLAGSVVTTLSILPLLASGVTLHEYWNGAWQILFAQVHALSAGQRLKLIASTWTNPDVTPYYVFVLLYLFQKSRLQKAGVPFWSLLVWLALAFVGANASNVYRHQLKQVMLPLSLIAGLGIGSVVESTAGFTARWVVWLYLSIVVALAPFNSVLIGISKQMCPEVMPCPGASEERTNRTLAAYLRSHSDPSEYIYIWAINSHPIHLYAERRSSCRYFNAIFRFAPDFEATTAAELAAHPPRLIAINDAEATLPAPPACVTRLLAEHYESVCRVDGFEVFRIKQPSGPRQL